MNTRHVCRQQIKLPVECYFTLLSRGERCSVTIMAYSVRVLYDRSIIHVRVPAVSYVCARVSRATIRVLVDDES